MKLYVYIIMKKKIKKILTQKQRYNEKVKIHQKQYSLI